MANFEGKNPNNLKHPKQPESLSREGEVTRNPTDEAIDRNNQNKIERHDQNQNEQNQNQKQNKLNQDSQNLGQKNPDIKKDNLNK